MINRTNLQKFFYDLLPTIPEEIPVGTIKPKTEMPAEHFSRGYAMFSESHAINREKFENVTVAYLEGNSLYPPCLYIPNQSEIFRQAKSLIQIIDLFTLKMQALFLHFSGKDYSLVLDQIKSRLITKEAVNKMFGAMLSVVSALESGKTIGSISDITAEADFLDQEIIQLIDKEIAGFVKKIDYQKTAMEQGMTLVDILTLDQLIMLPLIKPAPNHFNFSKYFQSKLGFGDEFYTTLIVDEDAISQYRYEIIPEAMIDDSYAGAYSIFTNLVNNIKQKYSHLSHDLQITRIIKDPIDLKNGVDEIVISYNNSKVSLKRHGVMRENNLEYTIENLKNRYLVESLLYLRSYLDKDYGVVLNFNEHTLHGKLNSASDEPYNTQCFFYESFFCLRLIEATFGLNQK
ncbi:hypothetical protein HZA96_06345 [Candidatus Woesearchaeota archaeon]|nr:hypothetical protein [Candidatus Woesearchaeota archaeon]